MNTIHIYIYITSYRIHGEGKKNNSDTQGGKTNTYIKRTKKKYLQINILFFIN